MSSVSPQRRVGSQAVVSPFSHTNQQTFSYTHPLPSPQSHGPLDYAYGQNRQAASITGSMYGNRNLRARPSVQYVPTRHSINGVLPTPDPTVGGSMSVISDEDVALQQQKLLVGDFFEECGGEVTCVEHALGPPVGIEYRNTSQ